MKKHTKRKGLSLVELLIVMILLGILTARLLITNREGAVSALASEIISDFGTIKTAATAYYLDHSRKIAKEGLAFSADIDATVIFADYLTNENSSQRISGGEKNQYFLCNYGKDWYVKCYVSNKDVMQRLKARKESVGLCEPPQNDSTKAKELTADIGWVGMCIFKIN